MGTLIGYFRSAKRLSYTTQGVGGDKYVFTLEGKPTRVERPTDVENFRQDVNLMEVTPSGEMINPGKYAATAPTPLSRRKLSDVLSKDEREAALDPGRLPGQPAVAGPKTVIPPGNGGGRSRKPAESLGARR